MTNKDKKPNRPWHLWIVNGTMLFLSSIGVYDFIMIQAKNKEYIDAIQATQNVADYFADYPLALSIIWGINVFALFLASVLLLFRSKLTLSLILTSAAAMFLLNLITFGFRQRWQVFGASASLTDITVFLLTIAFYFYCKNLREKAY